MMKCVSPYWFPSLQLLQLPKLPSQKSQLPLGRISWSLEGLSKLESGFCTLLLAFLTSRLRVLNIPLSRKLPSLTIHETECGSHIPTDRGCHCWAEAPSRWTASVSYWEAHLTPYTPHPYFRPYFLTGWTPGFPLQSQMSLNKANYSQCSNTETAQAVPP